MITAQNFQDSWTKTFLWITKASDRSVNAYCKLCIMLITAQNVAYFSLFRSQRFTIFLWRFGSKIRYVWQ